MSRFRLERDKAALLVVDVQERLLAAMSPEAQPKLIKRTVAAIQGARALGLPIIATEQYPKGLGPTVAAVREALGEVKPVEKLEFGAALPAVMAALGGRTQILITGMETHVCVFQTARDLADRQKVPYLCVDAVLSRTEEERKIGLDLCREVGAVVTSVEAALFDLLGRAGTPEFKLVSQAVK
jgi:nicotinamidase-related amidase